MSPYTRSSSSERWARILLLVILVASAFMRPEAAQARPAYAPVASVSLNLPAEGMIGETITFTAVFDNTGPAGDTGYGPYLDLFLPYSGVDGSTAPGVDGLWFSSSNYLGATVSSQVLACPAGGNVLHPLTGLTVACPAAPAGMTLPFTWQLAVLTLPFGSFTADQPPAVVTVSAAMSQYADLSVPLPVILSGGYRYGADPLDNPLLDPPILGGSTTKNITPTLLKLRKTYLGPEDETATGPNFPRQYRIDVDIASGQTITSLDVSDILPPNLAFLQVVTAAPAGFSVLQTPTLGAAAAAPDNDLVVRFASVTGGTGTADASVTLEFFVPRDDAYAARVIDPQTGDDVLSINDARAEGDWTPLDSRDLPTSHPITDITAEDHRLTDKSIAIQKSVANLTDGANSPGDVLEYTLTFQVSDFFAFKGLVITDTFSDGQHWQGTFTPTLQIDGNPFALPAQNMAGANITVDVSQIAGDTDPATNGSTTVIFRISDEMISRGESGLLPGGCVPPGGTGGPAPDCLAYNNGPSTAVLRFRTVIQDLFTDTYPSGDSSVDQGDILNNSVTISGALLSTSDTAQPTGFTEPDGSAASVVIAKGSLAKSIYAINGVVCPGGACTSGVQIAPADTLTYRIKYTLPTSDVEAMTFYDYLPLPVFYASEIGTTFDATVSAAPPPAGQAKFGPADTFYVYAGLVPTVTIDNPSNYVKFAYGNYDNPLNQSKVVDLLFTVTASSNKFADGLFLTNQARAYEGTTNAGDQIADSIIQVQLTQPVLRLTKGVVSADAPSYTFAPAAPAPVSFSAPGSGCPRASGAINSTSLQSAPIDSNLAGIDAGDRVTFALMIENTGSGLNGAFDIRLSDVLPANFAIPAGGLNLCVTDGTGAVMSYTTLGSGLFDPAGGIEIGDPGATASPTGALDPFDPSSGRNILIVTYDLTAQVGVQPRASYASTATLFNYTGREGGPDYTSSDLTDAASVTTKSPAIAKDVLSTNQASTTGLNAALGEIITYRVVITVPEGTTNAASLVDSLDANFYFVDCISVSASPGLSTSQAGGFAGMCNDGTTASFNPRITGTGGIATFTLGNISNANTDNATPETLVFVYTAVVSQNTNTRGTLLNNSATFNWNNGASQTLNTSAPNVVVVVPTLAVTKTASGTGDAGDDITFRVVLTHTAVSNATAFDVTLSDAIPAQMVYKPGSLTQVAGPIPDSASVVGQNLSLTFNSLPTTAATIVFTFTVNLDASVVPGISLVNTVTAASSSLPGVVSSAQSPYNTNSREATFSVNGSSVSVVRGPSQVKSLKSTSETFTTGSRVAVGEIVRYKLSVQLPEGNIPNMRVYDQLPAGLHFLNDGTAKLAFVSNGGGITSATVSGTPACDGLSGTGLNMTGNADTITPTFVLPDTAINSSSSALADVYDADADPYFWLCNITNSDRDSDNEYVVIEFNALVYNLDTNQAYNQSTAAAITTNRDNYMRVGNQVGASTTWLASLSSQLRVTLSEPIISNLAKRTITNASDAGDMIVYQIVFSNTNNSTAGLTPAFNVMLTDTLDSNLTLVSSRILSPGVIWTNNSVGNSVRFSIAQLNTSVKVRLLITATVNSSAPVGFTIPNNVRLTYTSLPGDYGTTGNSTASMVTDLPGSLYGERIGSGTGNNDYQQTGSAGNPLAAPTIAKQMPTPSTYAIGGVATYNILVTLPEGVINNMSLVDNLPAGMTFVPGSVQIITSAAASGGLLTADYNGTLAANGVDVAAGSGGDVTVSFSGNTTTAADNVAGNNRFVIRLQALVMNETGNQSGTVLSNSASFTYTDPNTSLPSTPIVSGPVNITVIEPVLAMQKAAVSVNPGLQAGATISYRVTFTNTNPANSAPAYNVIFSDTLPVTLTLQTATVTLKNGAANETHSQTGNRLDVTVEEVPVNGSVVVDYTATLNHGLAPGETIPNTGTVAWSSQPGAVTEERLNGNGWQGGGGLNDYALSSSVSLANTGAIGDRVWYDVNTNGVQDGGEPGYPTLVTLRWAGPDGILNTADDRTYAQTTPASGAYGFTGLPAGSYTIQVAVGGYYTYTLPDQGGNTAFDSNVNQLSGVTPEIILGVGEVNDTIDAGVRARPTAVDMGEMTVSEGPDRRPLIRWSTLNEWNVVGFYVYRSEIPGGAAVLLNSDLIIAHGGAQGAEYTFTDQTARPGQACTYTIVQVLSDGSQKIFGPLPYTTLRYLFLPSVRK